MVYAACKAEGERAAFNGVKKNNPEFVFNSVLPDYTVNSLPMLCWDALMLTSYRSEKSSTLTSAQPES